MPTSASSREWLSSHTRCPPSGRLEVGDVSHRRDTDSGGLKLRGCASSQAPTSRKGSNPPLVGAVLQQGLPSAGPALPLAFAVLSAHSSVLLF